jgi:hypothetical protein
MGRKGLAVVVCAWVVSACAGAPVGPAATAPSRTITRPPASVATVTATTERAVVTPTVPDALQTIMPPVMPPSASVASCAIQATRTPAPNAPTVVSSGAGQPERQVDPHVEICAGATRLKVGDRFVVLGMPVDVGLPIYTLSIKDSGATEEAFVGVDYNNKLSPSRGASRVLEVEAAKGEMRLVAFLLRAREPGAAVIGISASGEIHYGYPGPATWAGGGSESLSITVEAR